MIEIEIPGFKNLALSHLVLDYNGTMAIDGLLIDGVEQALSELAQHLTIHVLTADTFGVARNQLSNTACSLHILDSIAQDEVKRQFVTSLGPEKVVCIGNGRNDRLMLKEAVLSIAVFQAEGAASETCLTATILCPHILHALRLLQYPKRLIATLRK